MFIYLAHSYTIHYTMFFSLLFGFDVVESKVISCMHKGFQGGYQVIYMLEFTYMFLKLCHKLIHT